MEPRPEKCTNKTGFYATSGADIGVILVNCYPATFLSFKNKYAMKSANVKHPMQASKLKNLVLFSCICLSLFTINSLAQSTIHNDKMEHVNTFKVDIEQSVLDDL